ncbi:MAG: chromate transporter [Peptococcaceae bacterium]|nr:chromate transporter [Peptococcaceae bacterium]
MNIYLLLCLEFAKISVFAVGGGLASLPFLYAMADKYGWFSYGELANMIAVSESTPGPIGINMATYVGYTCGGVAGGILSTLSYVLPSVIIGTFVAGFLQKFKTNATVEAAFYGLRPAVCGLIAAAGYQILTISILDIPAFQAGGGLAGLFNLPAILMFAVMTALTFKVKWHPVIYIVIAAAVGVVLKF